MIGGSSETRSQFQQHFTNILFKHLFHFKELCTHSLLHFGFCKVKLGKTNHCCIGDLDIRNKLNSKSSGLVVEHWTHDWKVRSPSIARWKWCQSHASISEHQFWFIIENIMNKLFSIFQLHYNKVKYIANIFLWSHRDKNSEFCYIFDISKLSVY